MSWLRFNDHVGHELRALVSQALCSCGAPIVDDGRCEACNERRMDLRYEASREPEDEA